MSNQPQKQKRRFLRLSDGWRSLINLSLSPSPSNAAQTGLRASVSSSSRVSSQAFCPSSPICIQSVDCPVSSTQLGSSKHDSDHPSSYSGRSPSRRHRVQLFNVNSHLAKDYAKTTLNGAYELLKVVNESSDLFTPLKSLVAGVVACVDMYKKTSGNYDEMERVLTCIDRLASVLATKLSESKDHKQLDQMMKNLCQSLEEEDKKIKAMLERGFIVRLANNSDDAGELVSSCQAIKDSLDIFHVELTLLLERNTHDILKHVIFQSLPRSRNAAFSAAINIINVSRGPCTEGTRVDIIEQIMGWAKENDPAKAPTVYWLNGLAGLGKTTIAYTICKLLEEAKVPSTSFFCSRQLDSKNSKLLITTLCRDLAELFSSYASEVLPVLESNSKIVDEGLRRHMDELLAKPWQSSLARRDCLQVPVVVVDALDESDRGTEFLQELLRVVESGKLTRIKFLVTSRPDPRLVDMCKSFPANAVCRLQEVDTANVQKDIERYLSEALPDLKDEHELVELAHRAGGLFIYAATAVRFISPLNLPFSASEKRSQLQNMLSSWPTSAGWGGRMAVDELYEQILGVTFGDDRVSRKRLQILHTVLCAESSINMSVLADLSDTDQDTVKTVVDSLHAVLFVSSKDNCVYWYHTSFPDFIFDQERAKFRISPQSNYPNRDIDVCCDVSAHHAVLACQCFSIMQKLLHFNMCDLDSSYIFDFDVPELNDRKHKQLTPTLRYASRHWARHLSRAAPAENDTNDLFLCLNKFMYDKLLFWIEAMNLIDTKSECSPLLRDAEDWVKRGKQYPDLLRYLTDAANFSTFFAGSPASKSTPHLYISALLTWSQDSPVCTHWRPRFAFMPSISLPRGTITVSLLTMTAMAEISCVAFSPDGNQIVSGDLLVRVWDAKTGRLLRELQGHTGGVGSVAFSPDGNQIVSGSGDQLVRVWDAKMGEQLSELQGHTELVSSVAFSPNGNNIVSGSYDKSMRVWDVKMGEQLMELKGHTDDVNSVAFSPDGNQIVSGSYDRSVRVWDAKTGKQLRELRGDNGVTSVAFSPDSNQIISGSYRSIWVWDAKTGEQLRELEGHTRWVNSVAFSPDGNKIVSGSNDYSVRVWDVKMGEQLMELKGHTNWVNSVAFSPDGNQIISGSEDLLVQVWDAKTDEQLRPGELQGHTSEVNSVAFSPDSNQIISGSDDRLVRVWDAKTGGQLRELQGHTGPVSSVAFSPDGNKIVSGSVDRSVRVWDMKTGKQLRKLQGHTDEVTSVAFSPDGNQIVSGSYDQSVRVWDAKMGEQLRELQGPNRGVASVAFSPDSNQIISGHNDQLVRVWDAKTGEQLREFQLEVYTDRVNSVAFSPDNNQFVSGSYQLIRVWDAKTGEQLRELQGHTGRVNSVTFSPDNKLIISGSDDHSVRVWDAKTGELLRELQGHTNDVYSVAFSPDGNQIVSGSADQSVRVWDAKMGEQLQGHTSYINSAVVSPHSNQIVSRSEDQSAHELANLGLDASWVMDEDGWILSDAKRLIWIPSTVRNVLRRPQNILIISRHGSATISFRNSKLGPSWHECFIR
ncbi:WD40 repeat-like protein [Phlegmacium glaucopus]|nr:WD40 repeat-like protein [Phlegmacium glaucopus]